MRIIYKEVINATPIGFGPGIYNYGLSSIIPIKIMKPFFGIISRFSFPFIVFGICRYWEYYL